MSSVASPRFLFPPASPPSSATDFGLRYGPEALATQFITSIEGAVLPSVTQLPSNGRLSFGPQGTVHRIQYH